MTVRSPENFDSRAMTRRRFLRLASLSAAGLVVGCAVDPITGKKQLMLVSEDAEIQVDKQQAPHQFSTDYGLIQDQTVTRYLDQVGKQLVPNTHRTHMPYAFHGVNATYVNAYTFPGGTMAITRGILLKMDNEAELAGLIGHELGHVNARHTAEQMTKSQLTAAVLTGVQAIIGSKYSQYADLTGQLGMLGAGMLLAHYSRDNEREADSLGNRYMVQSGYNTQGFVGLMEMLNSLSKGEPGYAQVLFSTHPMSRERYESAVEAATTTYQMSSGFPLNRDRYMDNIASLRAIQGPIESMQKADAAMGQKKYPEAESLLRSALKGAPRDYTGLVMMAKCQIAQKRFSEAERYAADAKRVFPKEAQAYHINGFAKLQRKSFDSAHREFASYDRMLPGNPNITFFKGYCMEGMGNRQEAANEYARFLKVVREGDLAQHAYGRLVAWGYVRTQS